MNIPNRITLARVCMIPLFVIFMVLDFPWGEVQFGDVTLTVAQLLATLIFIIASTTDWIDGYYARKYNLVTNLGKFLDPLADKLLVSSAFIILVEYGLAPSWVVILIISREFAVTGLRLILAGGGEVVAANMLGKIKTWTQIIAIIALLLENVPFSYIDFPFADIMLYIALFFTLWSGLDYFMKNKQVFSQSK
ncbi:CDP-diacylglycerol--glycerol-3-phosphate 3-phosphatidyltransferase [Caldibacillus thermolactis]|uniref:CDP-diacylglycerol--glycerol-3-phosphate 3-phosphatidyltransferase n=1 Tax=Pallidibacillus thermolactis TaxID=251051 RepID=A0ABT2WC17_9BACI|nr:CDP-diacylglycerol--glycerol-3-phosphate 3-phosphatidyltransferase [Pallidibacillus thermolactis]MCU9593022.1 CDP-diacylglycerol--glycerol-3-phosphate 3-phosphatidyltransferase [Pallidibacillus thermolactis]MCU9600688.1 CDP-diacylglycerol--glycerol-3-phosphate 3-phosphatidyltransferase [Pallidibacillus thermolactis subsp. kokeshiiformis]MED1672076.1 CDP-diacylglycerol--glycerol-3-phosphate 3-phosphatidyltransferase [Pallidibacillus thermolactis subsp. kokeshiiformis]